MKKRVSFWVTVIFLLTFASAALAQGPDKPEDSDPTWRASYWNNKHLTGNPVVQRDEVNLDHDWMAGSPHAGLNADGFSARWTKYIYADAAGIYRFTATSDDGVRVWVDNDLIIDRWTDHPPTTFNADRYLSKGHHWVKVEFYENKGGAVIRFTWGPASAPPSAWRCEFFDNPTLSGNPGSVRDVDQINFDWGAGSPSPGTIGVDRFSARCSATIDVPAGRYRFALTVDDGGRLRVNHHLLINVWKVQPATTYAEEIYLPGGSIPIEIEYYENTGNAVLGLSRQPLSPTIQDWRGEYFDNMTLSGSPALVRNDAQIDFDWGAGSPASGTIGADRFSVRWTQTKNFAAGRYRFVLRADDGVRLWVNNRLLIEAWRDQPATTYTAEIDLPARGIPIRLEYYEHTGQAVARLSWDQGGPSPSPGTVIVDDTDPGFTTGGSPTGWRRVYEGYGGHLTWTWNNDWQRPYYNWARWSPDLAPGQYEVYVFVPHRYTTTSRARYVISHAGGHTSRLVDQSTNGGLWVSVGTYRFSGNSKDYVSLTDATGEVRLTHLIAFDAVKWVPR